MRRVRRESADPQTRGGNLRLDEDGGRISQAQVQGHAQYGVDLPARSGSVQSCPNGANLPAGDLRRTLGTPWKAKNALQAAKTGLGPTPRAISRRASRQPSRPTQERAHFQHPASPCHSPSSMRAILSAIFIAPTQMPRPISIGTIYHVLGPCCP